MSNDFVNIGERIELKLKELNLKQIDICKKTGISKNAISNYVNNNRIPDTISCYKISKALFVSMEWLLVGADYNNTNILIESECNNNELIDIKEEKDFILNYRKLDSFDKDMIVNIVKMMHKRMEK